MKIYKENICIAPLLNYINPHSVYFYNLLINKIKIYIGMIHTSSFLYKTNFYYKFLNQFNINNSVIQFISNNYKDLYKCIKLINCFKFSEINLNIGCPSLNSKKCKFGVYLMKDINIIINCLNSIKDAVNYSNIELSIKHRLGLYKYSYNFLLDFLGKISLYTSCKKFIIHARYVLKNNCSTYLNLIKLDVNYNIVYRLKKDLPHLNIIINGNINNLFDIKNHLLNNINGVMIGRGVYFNPLFLLAIKKFISNYNYIYKYQNILNFNQSIFFKKNKISKYIIWIFYKLYYYIIFQNKYNNVNILNIFKHIIYIFKNIKYASLFRKRFINSINYFNNFKNYLDFIYFIFNGFI